MLRPAERKDVSRAVGRVLVHEVVHAIAPSLAHAGSGLMHQTLSTGALLRDRVTVDEGSRRAFLAALVRFERSRLGPDDSPE